MEPLATGLGAARTALADLVGALPAQRTETDPVHDVDRLAAVAALDPFGTDVQPLVEDLLHHAADALATEVALLTVVLDDAQLLVAQVGTDGTWLAEAAATPVEWSLCAHAVASRETFVLPSTAEDDRSRDNPLVTVDGLASYAGAPVLTSDGSALGALCVLGRRPADFSPAQLDVLRGLADEAARRLEDRAARRRR